jgi:hypothetical protein
MESNIKTYVKQLGRHSVATFFKTVMNLRVGGTSQQIAPLKLICKCFIYV